MNTRILHCSNSIENYNLCIEHSVAGFSNRGPQQNDIVYLAVKVGKKTLCGARFRLGAFTERKPWPNEDRYVHALEIKEVEYCQPFDLSILSSTGGKHWSIKYVQSSKPIKDKEACELLHNKFTSNKVEYFIPFEVPAVLTAGNGKMPETDSAEANPEASLIRESIKVQAKLAEIGARMGYKVWLPRNDRNRVLEVWPLDRGSILEGLPLNYDIDTIVTIENIDVIWIQGRTIVRAFEIEHTTSIYSGILRMADLMALQPNLNICAHIVAPVERREKVLQELSRPVFKHTLAPKCSFISYDAVEDLAQDKKLKFMTDAVLGAYSESAI